MNLPPLTQTGLPDVITELLRELGRLDPTVTVTHTSDLTADLGLDSLDLLELVVSVEDHYGVVVDDTALPAGPVCVSALWACIASPGPSPTPPASQLIFPHSSTTQPDEAAQRPQGAPITPGAA